MGAEDGQPSHELDDNPRYLVLRGFRSRLLPDARDLFVYLPEAYLSEPRRRFPVFLLHDGQNVFDTRTSYVPGHTWRAHCTADRLTSEGRMEPVILVGIANTGLRRMAEYTPTRDAIRGGGDGPLYGRLLVEELLPLIGRSFRTLPGAENTGLGGSSLGGLISLAIGLEYPEVFGRLAVMSPSVWWNQRSIFDWINARVAAPAPIAPKRRSNTHPEPAAARPRAKIWLDMGTSEGLRHLRDADLLHRRLVQRGWRDGVNIRYLRVAGGVHTEDAWAARFDRTLEFLWGRGQESGKRE